MFIDKLSRYISYFWHLYLAFFSFFGLLWRKEFDTSNVLVQVRHDMLLISAFDTGSKKKFKFNSRSSLKRELFSNSDARKWIGNDSYPVSGNYSLWILGFT